MSKTSRVFFLKLIIFLSIISADVIARTWYEFQDDRYQSEVVGKEAYWALKKSGKTKKVKKVILGDSVAFQLFSSKVYNDNIYALTTNKAFSMVGNYILIKNFIDSNSSNLPEQVILLYHPTSFNNDLTGPNTFHNFLKPLYCQPYKQEFSEEVFKQVYNVPYYYLSQIPMVKASNWAPTYPPPLGPDSWKPVSAISMDYLLRIKSLCDSLGISFVMVSPPINEAMKERIDRIRGFILRDSSTLPLRAEFVAYFDNLKYSPAVLYKDEAHFKDPQQVDRDYILSLDRK